MIQASGGGRLHARLAVLCPRLLTDSGPGCGRAYVSGCCHWRPPRIAAPARASANASRHARLTPRARPAGGWIASISKQLRWILKAAALAAPQQRWGEPPHPMLQSETRINRSSYWDSGTAAPLANR